MAQAALDQVHHLVVAAATGISYVGAEFPRDESAAGDRFRERPGRRLSFTDCTSFAVLRRIGVEEVLCLDEDFAAEGFTDVLTTT